MLYFIYHRKERFGLASKKGKRVKRVLVIILCVTVLLSALVAGANVLSVQRLIKQGSSFGAVQSEDKLIPQRDENGYWYFTTDRDFKVLHLTDIHIGGGFLSVGTDEKAVNAVAAMIIREKPDLVVTTGDIAFPAPHFAGTFNNFSAARAFANLMEGLGVYWTVTFGNHDAEAYSYFDREALGEFYSNEEYKYCLFSSGPVEVDGFGNHVIEVKNSQGIITQAMIMIDSQAYVKDDIITSIKGIYDNIHANQVEWYEAEIKRMNAENAETVSGLSGDGSDYDKFTTVRSIAFFHIPLAEAADGWFEFEANGFEDTEDFTFIDGFIGEVGRRIYSAEGEDQLFEKMLELGSTKAMFYGHDHLNSTTFEYKGIQFSYGYSIDYLAYADIDTQGSQRGCTLITCTPDGDFTIEKFNYYSDRYEMNGFFREEVSMQFEGMTYQVPAE